jgi:CRP/FNR family transcriptional regulator, dissimilatory nitrate respiration regulator
MKTIAPPDIPPALRALLPAILWGVCIPSAMAKGERLFRQGRTPEHMFYVASGELILQRQGAQGDNVVLQRTRQGFVAEASLQSARYHCDAMVTAAGQVVAVPVDAIRHMLASDPAFAMRWMAMLNQELKRLRLQCERLSLKGVKSRLLHLLETEGQHGSLPLGAGLKSLAAELGVTHEALYRAVAELEGKRVLEREDGCLRIVRS